MIKVETMKERGFKMTENATVIVQFRMKVSEYDKLKKESKNNYRSITNQIKYLMDLGRTK